MAKVKFAPNHGVQYRRANVITVEFDSLESGVATLAAGLPDGAIFLGGALVVQTAFNSATSDTLAVGDGTTADEYLAATDVAAVAATALKAAKTNATAASHGERTRGLVVPGRRR